MSEWARSESARSESSRSEVRETGDREAFLARVRNRQGPPPVGGPHPPPPAPDVVPVMRYRNLDDVTDQAGLIDVFTSTAVAAEATVDVLDESQLDEALARVVSEHAVTTAVVSREPEAVAAGKMLERLGITVADFTPERAEAADLAVTSATHGIAATGSVVVDTRAAGSRAVSLLPRVHLCLLPADRIVASPSDVLRHPEPDGLPSCRVVITGPSRTGDIEQRLTLGAHGPVALHVVVIV